jgi:hypothetical protein
MSGAALDFAHVVAAYIKTRDEKDALAEKHKAELAPLNENLKKMEGWFLAKLNEAGLKNAKTEHGTVLTVERCNIKVTDRHELEIFASLHDLDFFVAEVDTKAIKEYLDNSASRIVPPGIEVSYLVSAQVRRA